MLLVERAIENFVCGKTPVGETGFDLDFSSQSGLHQVRRQRRNGAERSLAVLGAADERRGR
jgi:hypothetical protein